MNETKPTFTFHFNTHTTSLKSKRFQPKPLISYKKTIPSAKTHKKISNEPHRKHYYLKPNEKFNRRPPSKALILHRRSPLPDHNHTLPYKSEGETSTRPSENPQKFADGNFRSRQRTLNGTFNPRRAEATFAHRQHYRA